MAADPQNLVLGVIGNCTFNALVDNRASIVWSCLPRPDGDPVFHSLLSRRDAPDADRHGGFFSIDLENYAHSRQFYLANTAVVVTELFDQKGQGLRVTDFAPRFAKFDRMFRPLQIVRRIEPIAGLPRIRVRVRPEFDYGASQPSISRGSNHVRYVHANQGLRLTADMPVAYVLDETFFLLDRSINLIFGVDETVGDSVSEMAREFEERTASYWRHWARALHLPLEWQDAVIRSAITLKLCTFEETGAIVAAMTTSVPEAPDTQRNWDYRYCWLRDSFFVVRALNSLSEMTTMENYLRYLLNVMHVASRSNHLQPVYGIALESALTERIVEHLPGYRGMGPVRVGNQAYEHLQHDVYGHAVLAATQAFFDRRLLRPAGSADFDRMQWLGERALALFDQPDAGIWEYRTKARIHTSSSIMCWAACDRLARIAIHLGNHERANTWRENAERIREVIYREAWSDKRQAFVDSFGGEDLDASVLLMGEVGLVKGDDPRWGKTLQAIGAELRQGNHLYRYRAPDDFGQPKTAFTVCTFWYVDALAKAGRIDEARELFENLLSCCNSLGLLSEDIDTVTGELWGNYPQTYSLVGIINGAMRLSRKWESVL
jgi:GH15 family glucan-1,4-alpha-glucosidase